MNENIFYLTKASIFDDYGLIFPSEIEDENYYGLGNLYIIGAYLNNTYKIQAVFNEKIIEIELKLENTNMYTCDVKDIGKFNFYIEKLYKPMKYIGQTNYLKNTEIYYRLRLINTQKAEYYAREYNFYFIGNE